MRNQDVHVLMYIRPVTRSFFCPYRLDRAPARPRHQRPYFFTFLSITLRGIAGRVRPIGRGPRSTPARQVRDRQEVEAVCGDEIGEVKKGAVTTLPQNEQITMDS